MLHHIVLPLKFAIPLAIVTGLLAGIGYAPLGVWPATILAVGLLTWQLSGARLRSAFGRGYLAGLAMNAVTVSWISVLGLWIGVALVAFLALWWGLLGMAISLLTRLKTWWLLIPAAWVAMEYVSGLVPLGGFAWTRLGYTAIDQPMSGYFAWLGLAGVSFLLALAAQLLLLAVVHRGWRRRSTLAVVCLVLLGGLLNWTPLASPEQHVTIAVVQPGVNRAEHGTSSYARSVTNNALSETIFALATSRTRSTELSFVLWPENATDIDPVNDPATNRLVQRAVQLAQVPILVGAVTDGPTPDTRQTTSLWWEPDNGPGQQYHKRNLVPFGEWIPFREVLLPRMPILRQIGRQSIPGHGPGVITESVSQIPHLSVGTIICFELAYDETVYDVIDGQADVVVSQSNVNTYVGTFEPHQQLVINRVRAMELGREIVVSTLNSFTGLVDARGRAHEPTPELLGAHRIFTVPLRHNINLAVLLSPWTSWLACLVTVAGLAAALPKRQVASKLHTHTKEPEQ